MPLLFNDILRNVGIDPKRVRLLRHKDSSSAKGRSPYEMWRDDRQSFEFYQSIQLIKNRSNLRAEHWAAFVVTPGGQTLLAGIYDCRYCGLNESDLQAPNKDAIDVAGTCDVYELTLDAQFNDLAGRLVIEWGKGTPSWIQRADNQDKVILELWAEFREDAFPGFAQFISSASQIGKLPKSWVEALSATKGVYLLVCPKTKEQYVGSASGSDGFIGRWKSYAQDGDGGNLGLRSREPSDYQITILETVGMSATQKDITALEQHWMEKLRSNEMGLNRRRSHP